MNRKSLILALALGFVITGCKDSDLPQSKVSEETIAKALDGKVDLEKEQKEEEKKEKTADQSTENEKWQANGKNLKQLMIDMGEFAPSLARKLDGDDLVKLYKKCEKMSERTGYWDVKDLFLPRTSQRISRQIPQIPTKIN